MERASATKTFFDRLVTLTSMLIFGLYDPSPSQSESIPSILDLQYTFGEYVCGVHERKRQKKVQFILLFLDCSMLLFFLC